jgi:hypothetical protein
MEDEQEDDDRDGNGDRCQDQPAGSAPGSNSAFSCLLVLICHEAYLLGRLPPVASGFGPVHE